MPAFRQGVSLVEEEQELLPVLGHVVVRPRHLKFHSQGFNHVLRVVMRVGSKVVASCPKQNDISFELDAKPVRFAVTSQFQHLSIEVWDNKDALRKKKQAAESTKGPTAEAAALMRTTSGLVKAALDSAGGAEKTAAEAKKKKKKSQGGADELGNESEKTHKIWGRLVASARVSTFDLLEHEAQTIFKGQPAAALATHSGRRDGEPPGTAWPLTPCTMPALKLRLEGKESATIVLEAQYSEEMGGILATNPNPIPRPPKPFSLANVQHEISRTGKVFGWLGAFGAHVGSLLEWESVPKTIGVMVAMGVACMTRMYAERPLAFIPFCLIVHILNRHKKRADGRFLEDFKLHSAADGGGGGGGGSDASYLAARVRVAVVQARALLPMDDNGLSDPAVRVSLRKHHGHSAQLQELGRYEAQYATLAPNFADSGLHAIKASGSHGSRVVGWGRPSAADDADDAASRV